MSDAATPFVAAVDGHRGALELTHRAVSGGLDLQRRAARSFVDGVDAQQEATERATEAVTSAVETSLLLANATGWADPAAFDELEYRFGQQFDALGDFQDVTWSTIARSMEDGLVAYERFASVYADAVDASFAAALEGTDRTAEGLARSTGRRERAVEVDIEVEEP